jgi:16S rRNA processing protein RimM
MNEELDFTGKMAIGRIRTSHGLLGYVKFESFSDEYEHFLRLKKVYILRQRKFALFDIERISSTGKHWLMKLSGIDSPEAGRTLANCELYVDREYASALNENEYYLSDILNCDASLRGNTIGTVSAWYDVGYNVLLEVELTEGQKSLIPFNEMFIGRIDTEDRTIEILEDWILE